MITNRLEEIRKEIEALSFEDKKTFFSDVVPDLCDSSLTREGCRVIFEKRLSGSRYVEAFDELHTLQGSAREVG